MAVITIKKLKIYVKVFFKQKIQEPCGKLNL